MGFLDDGQQLADHAGTIRHGSAGVQQAGFHTADSVSPPPDADRIERHGSGAA
jgi:hypothetical protein